MSARAVDNIHPEDILKTISRYHMAFAESMKGEGHADDGRFFNLDTDWRQMAIAEIKAIYLEHLRRNVASACSQGFNFMEFWGWPEVRAREDTFVMVHSRLRMLTITPIFNPRPN